MIIVKKLIDWPEVLEAARITANKTPSFSYPSEEFIKRMILAEHSPLRMVMYSFYWTEIKSWIATHLLRHHVGTQPFVGTQREDRTGIPHSERKRDELVPFMFIVNAQSVINISKERLCKLASPETTQEWTMALLKLSNIDPLLGNMCVPKCVYRGFCPEANCCGYVQSKNYKAVRSTYIKGGILPLEGD